MVPDLALFVLSAALIGSAVGTFTGLVPGIHVNTVATILLAAYPLIEEAMSGIVGPADVPLLISCCIFSASTVHSFVDFVPSVFIGAPDADEALSVLPGHRLLLMGAGMVAVRAAALGSVTGALCSLALSVPLQWLMVNGLSDIMERFTFGMLTLTMAVLVLSSERRIVSLVLLMVSGMWWFSLDGMGVPCTGVLGEGTLLFPLLTGMFGVPPLLDKVRDGGIPPQRDPGRSYVGPGPGIRGVVTGMVAGWFPGITSTAGASLASAFVKEKGPEDFIAMVASIGTVTSVFSVVTLSVTGSGRSGTSMAVKDLIGDSLGGICSDAFMTVLFCIGVASGLGFVITVMAGKCMASVVDRVPTELLNDSVLVLMVALVFLFTGPFGLAVLALSTLLGMVPPALGVGRVSLVGCLLLPPWMGQLG
ncbi:MAG: tripartite tricarboxylate transporter permease, partial [archaeon]|nr:tripartite tricarboxylate transporter permease [archaeon]